MYQKSSIRFEHRRVIALNSKNVWKYVQKQKQKHFYITNNYNKLKTWKIYINNMYEKDEYLKVDWPKLVGKKVIVTTEGQVHRFPFE